jgi:hypothetical protein
MVFSRVWLFGAIHLLSNHVQAATYSEYTTSVFIPFLEADGLGSPSSGNVHFNVKISSPTSTAHFSPFIDTGSCGIVISAANLNDWDPSQGTDANKGWHYLSSSNWLYSGYWVPRDLYLEGHDDSNNVVSIKSTVPILAVTKKVRCPDYDVSNPGENCPTTPTETLNNPTGIEIMGIGFGREYDGQPQGTPDKNPLLHITSLSGRDTTQDSHYWPGYIISKAGITLGLTDANTASMEFTDLVAGGGTTPHWDLNFDWPELQACITITAPGSPVGDTTPCLSGSAVLDTGVANGFIRVPTDSVDLPRDADTFNLDSGTHVQVAFGSPMVATEQFEVGVSTDTDPSSVSPAEVRAVYSPGGRRATFINTSRTIYRKYRFAFDPVLGRAGFGPTA